MTNPGFLVLITSNTDASLMLDWIQTKDRKILRMALENDLDRLECTEISEFAIKWRDGGYTQLATSELAPFIYKYSIDKSTFCSVLTIYFVYYYTQCQVVLTVYQLNGLWVNREARPYIAKLYRDNALTITGSDRSFGAFDKEFDPSLDFSQVCSLYNAYQMSKIGMHIESGLDAEFQLVLKKVLEMQEKQKEAKEQRRLFGQPQQSQQSHVVQPGLDLDVNAYPQMQPQGNLSAAFDAGLSSVDMEMASMPSFFFQDSPQDNVSSASSRSGADSLFDELA